MYTKKVWTDLDEFIITKLNVNLQMNIFDVMVYFELYGLSKNVFFFFTNICYFQELSYSQMQVVQITALSGLYGFVTIQQKTCEN